MKRTILQFILAFFFVMNIQSLSAQLSTNRSGTFDCDSNDLSEKIKEANSFIHFTYLDKEKHNLHVSIDNNAQDIFHWDHLKNDLVKTSLVWKMDEKNEDIEVSILTIYPFHSLLVSNDPSFSEYRIIPFSKDGKEKKATFRVNGETFLALGNFQNISLIR